MYTPYVVVVISVEYLKTLNILYPYY